MRKTNRIRAVVAGIATVFGLVLVVPASPASAEPATGRAPVIGSMALTRVARPAYNYGPWTVVNSPGTYDSSPNRNYSSADPAANGAQVALNCYLYGAPAGPYGDPLWYQVGWDDWINDHYLNTPGTATNPQPQTPPCITAGSGSGIAYSPTFTAENSPGVWGNSPTAARDNSTIAISNNDTIGLGCYYFGNATGPYGNTLWYFADDLTNNTYGWINDHYLNTPGTAANPQPQTSRC